MASYLSSVRRFIDLYGTYPGFPGSSSFHGIHVFQLKLNFLTSCQVYWFLSSIQCKKTNKVKNVFVSCSIFFIDQNLIMGVMLYSSQWLEIRYRICSLYIGNGLRYGIDQKS